MLNVLTSTPVVLAASAMKATTALESMPPERNAATGTSPIIWLATARLSASLSASTASGSVHARRGTRATSQYRSTVTAPFR